VSEAGAMGMNCTIDVDAKRATVADGAHCALLVTGLRQVRSGRPGRRRSGRSPRQRFRSGLSAVVVGILEDSVSGGCCGAVRVGDC
jgi:hypothetical protein